MNNNSNNNVTLEVIVSTPKNGYTMEQVIAVDKEMEDNFVVKQPGFLKREVALKKDGTELFVVVHWATLADTEAAGEKFMTDTWGKKRMEVCEGNFLGHFIVN